MIFVIGLILFVVGFVYAYQRIHHEMTNLDAIAVIASFVGLGMMCASVLMLLWRLMP